MNNIKIYIFCQNIEFISDIFRYLINIFTYALEFKEQIANYEGQPITKQVLLYLLKDYKRPYDKIHELMKRGDLILLKRGIYIPGEHLTSKKPTPFLIANHLLGPSYISLESALAFWGLIPEKVYETSSVTIRKSNVYQTPVGRFSYSHIPLPYYSFGIRQVEVAEKQNALVASAEKALCDKIVTTSGIILRSLKQVMELLQEDLRIDKQQLQNLKINEINDWVHYSPKKSSLQMLVKTLKDL